LPDPFWEERGHAQDPQTEPPPPCAAAKFTPQQEAKASAISLVSDLLRCPSPKVPSLDPFWEKHHPPKWKISSAFSAVPLIANPASAPEDPFSALFSELQKQNTQSVRGH
jgi:hypothetical protein